MPTLKQITCTVECSTSNRPLKEYQTTYGDGYVQTFIAVPSVSTPFSVHLQSKGYIAPGLAMFVFMDGEYQCNRNRHNLKIPDQSTTSRQTDLDFRVRQKEELQADGTFAGSQWKFRELSIVPDTSARNLAPDNFEHIGTIEVVVLRCYPMDKPPKVRIAPQPSIIGIGQKIKQRAPTPVASPSPSSEDVASSDGDESESGLGGVFDGASDKASRFPRPMPFGGDGSWDDAGQSQGNGGQGSWQQQPDSRSWNNAPATNDSPAVGQGQVTSGQWDNQSHPAQSVPGSRSRSHNGSKRSRRSSITEEIPRVPTQSVAWGSQSGAQPLPSSPAVVVNVIQPGANAIASPVLPGCRSNDNGSKGSGSESHASSKNDEANDHNANNSWPDATTGAQDWGSNEPKTPTVPGAWDTQGAADWNNNNGNGDSGWAASNDSPQGSQNGQAQNGWNNGASNGGGNHGSQQENWNTGAGDNSGNGNGAWIKDGSPQQTSGANEPQQTVWDSKPQNQGQDQNWDNADNGNVNEAGQWNNFETPKPAFEASKKEQRPMSRHSSKVPSVAQGIVPSAAAGMPAVNPYQINKPLVPMPLQPKPYWNIWKADTEEDQTSTEESEVTEGPVYSVPREIAQRQMMSHQVLLSKPTIYMHKVSTPRYMDTHESPYAAFTFHYRSKGVLGQMLGIELTETVEEEKERLSMMSKKELVEHLLNAKMGAGSLRSPPGSTHSSSLGASKVATVHNTVNSEGSGLDVGGLLAKKLSLLPNKDNKSGGKPSTNPEVLWGRPMNQGLGLAGGPDLSANDHMAGWLNRSGVKTVGSPMPGSLPPSNSGGHKGSPIISHPQNNWNATVGGGAMMSGVNGQSPSVAGSRKGSGSQNKNGALWNNNGSQNGGGWNNGNQGGQNGSQTGGTSGQLQSGSNAAPEPQW